MGRKVVMVDLDNTIADTQTALIRFIQRRTGRTLSTSELAQMDTWAPPLGPLITEFLTTPDHIAQAAPHADALTAAQRLHAAGYEIHIVSSRADKVHRATLPWLQRHGYTDLVTEIHQRTLPAQGKAFKTLTAQRLSPAAVFDDDPVIAAAIAATGTPAYLIASGHRSDAAVPDGVIKADSFAAAVEQFLGKSE